MTGIQKLAAQARNQQQAFREARADPNYIGEGTYSRVFKYQYPDGTVVARKEFRLGMQSDKNFEASMMKKVGLHTNVIRMISQGDNFIDYEFLPKKDLRSFKHTPEYDTVTGEQAVQIIDGCLRGLEHIHKAINKAHFDIKPENILLTNQLQPKIADLGIVKGLDGVRHPHGTAAYMPPELFSQQLTDFRVDVYSLGVTMNEFIMGYHPFLRTKEDWQKNPEEMKKLMQVKAKDRVTLDNPKIQVSEHILALVREMMEPTLALRPSVSRCLEFLSVEDTQMQVQHLTEAHEHLQKQNTQQHTDIQAKDQQIRELHQAVRDLKSQKAQEIQTLTTQHVEEIQRLKHQLDESILLKTNHAFKRPAAPTPEIPRWQQTEWKYSSRDEVSMAFIAKRLNLDAEIFVAMEVAQFLRQIYIKQEPAPLTEYAQEFLEKLEDKKGNFSKSGIVELLLGCCLGITHTRDGAVNLICKCQTNGKSIRGKDTLHDHYTRMMVNGVIPQDFIQTDPHDSPPPDVIQFRTKRVSNIQPDTSNGASCSVRQADIQPDTSNIASSSVCQSDIEPGEIPQDDQATSESTWLQGNFKLSDEKVAAVKEFAKNIQLTEQHARDALLTADHVRRAKAGIECTLDSAVSRFFSTIHEQEGISNVGPMTLLLSIACLAFTGHIKSTVHLLGEFQVQGKEFRNWETLRKSLVRKKSLIPPILITD